MQADPQTEIPEWKDKKKISAVKLVVTFNFKPLQIFLLQQEALHHIYLQL